MKVLAEQAFLFELDQHTPIKILQEFRDEIVSLHYW